MFSGLLAFGTGLLTTFLSKKKKIKHLHTYITITAIFCVVIIVLIFITNNSNNVKNAEPRIVNYYVFDIKVNVNNEIIKELRIINNVNQYINDIETIDNIFSSSKENFFIQD